MLADGPTNVCALTPVIALLVVCCYSVGVCCFLVKFQILKVDGVDVDWRIGRCFARHKTVTNLNGPMPMYPGVYGHVPVQWRFSRPAPPQQGAFSYRLFLYQQMA